jgi:hypothetical protein
MKQQIGLISFVLVPLFYINLLFDIAFIPIVESGVSSQTWLKASKSKEQTIFGRRN